MNKSILFFASIASIFVLCCCVTSFAYSEPDIDTGSNYYLFAFFRDNEIPGGGAGLHYAWSADGLEWKELKEGDFIYKPKNTVMMRDPDIERGPDGTYHMVWTIGWHAENRGIGYASSKNLIDWSEDRVIRLMDDEPTARNFWAPETFYDDATNQFLIYWSTTIPGRFPKTDSFGDGGFNHRIYYITTKDFVAFTKAKLLIDPGFNCIDATIVKDGSEYVMFLKNETLIPAKKYILYAKSASAEGPYGKPSKHFTPQWSEGPTAVKIKGKWHIYYDMYSLHNYGVAVSADLNKWESLTPKLKLPKEIRHGTVIEIDGKTMKELLEKL